MSNYSSEKSKIHILGTLADQVDVDPYENKRPVFIKDNKLYFHIKAISQQPKNFLEARIFQVCSDDITHIGFVDSDKLSNEERISNLNEFFKELLLTFKIYTKEEGYGIYDIGKAEKPSGYLYTHKFIPIPLLDINKIYNTKNEFFESLKNKDFIDIDDEILGEGVHTPYVMAFKDECLKILGGFLSHTGENGRYKLEYNFLKCESLNSYWESNIVENLDLEGVLFVETTILLLMENEIVNGFEIQ